MNCPKCDRELVRYARFCGYCGERLVITCPSCEVLNPPDGLFCYNCGGSLTQAKRGAKSPELASGGAEQRQAVRVQCPRCETVNEPGSKYCYKCGLPLEEEQPQIVRQSRDAPVPSIPAAPEPGEQTYTLPPYRPPGRRAGWTIGLLATQCIAYGLFMLMAFRLFELTSQYEAGELGAMPRLVDARDSLDAALVLVFLAYIPTVVVFLMWMYRASKNLQALDAQGQRFSPRWAVGAWFIPFAHLVVPYKVIAEIWRGSDPESLSEMASNWKRGRVPALFGWWWGLFLVASFVERGLAVGSDQPSSDLLLFQLVIGALLICAGVFAILIVRRITSRQEEKHRRMMTSAER